MREVHLGRRLKVYSEKTLHLVLSKGFFFYSFVSLIGGVFENFVLHDRVYNHLLVRGDVF